MITFVDTNVLVYLHDASAGAKQQESQRRVKDLWSAGTGRVSVQVFQELYVNVTQKLPTRMTTTEARDVITAYRSWPTHVPDADAVIEASRVAERNRISFWDAMIVVSARAMGARVLLTEDLQHGQVIEGVRVQNPFASHAAARGGVVSGGVVSDRGPRPRSARSDRRARTPAPGRRS